MVGAQGSVKVVIVGLFLFGLAAQAGCRGRDRPEIRPGLDACHRCNMGIDKVNQAAGYLLDDRFVTFDSPICLLHTYEKIKKAGQPLPIKIFFADFESKALLSAASTTFLLTSHLPTVMNSETLAFGSKAAALERKSQADEIITDWVGLQTLRGTPDRLVEVVVGSDGMQPATITLARGALVEWQVRGKGLSEPLTLTIRGYERLGEIVVPIGDAPIRFRMLAELPGAGFPVLRADTKQPLGMVKVEGLHTPEEAHR